MDINNIVRRNMSLKPWAEGEKIPWNDPDFSRRMLKEHLSQRHDAASRRSSIIKKHVNWIHRSVLEENPSRILDLGCGPGLYSSRLASLGHTCLGIDFSPASIEYARGHSPAGCTYAHADVRTADYRGGYDLAMFIYGELNVFKKQDCRKILNKISKALKLNGKVLLEIQTFDTVEQLGNQPAIWYSSPEGLFSDKPHLCLMESFWDEKQSVATERYFVVDAMTGEVSRYASATQAYEDKEIKSMLIGAGFKWVRTYPSLTGVDETSADNFVVLVAQK